MSTPRRRRTDPPELVSWLETYPRGEVVALLVAPQAVFWADSPSILLALCVLFFVAAVLASG